MVQITVELNDSITLVSSDGAQPQIKSLELVKKNENSKKKEQHMKKNVNIYDKKTKMKKQ
jgi:hypothetical protein